MVMRLFAQGLKGSRFEPSRTSLPLSFSQHLVSVLLSQVACALWRSCTIRMDNSPPPQSARKRSTVETPGPLAEPSTWGSWREQPKRGFRYR